MAKQRSVKPMIQRKNASAARVLAPKRILVPIDFSETSLYALRYALTFARQFSGSLYVLHVYEAPSFLAGYQTLPKTVAAPDSEVIQKIRIQLDSLAEAENDSRVPIKTCVREGKAYDEIVRFAKAELVDLIIISTHGYTGLKHTLLGSTAERVVRHAPCPVLVVRQPE